MIRHKLFSLLLILFSAELLAQDVSPGFSCDGKLNYSERTICSDSYLSSLDEYLNILYRQYKELSFSQETLKADQLAWWEKRNSCKKHDCIVRQYNDRISEIIRGVKNIDDGFSALEPDETVEFFEKERDAYSTVTVEETVDGFEKSSEVFPKTFFRLISADIDSFKRLKSDQYLFNYSYQVAYKKLAPQTLKASFLVDSSGGLISVEQHENPVFLKLLDEIAKASTPDSRNNLDIMHSVLIELKSEGIQSSEKFLKYFEMEPEKTLKGIRDIQCRRHDDQLYLIKGSVLGDVLKCSWGHEVVDTYEGDDEIDGGWGDEIVSAGPGDDMVDGSWGDEMIYAGPGDDQLRGSHGKLTLLYGKNWGNDIVSGSCELIVFSSENKPEDVLWESEKIIINKNTGHRIKLGSPCSSVHFSDISFD